MLINPKPPSPPWYRDILTKAGEHVIPATLTCYLAGFLITNMYLGALGIVNLELLRARYILSGLLFLVFIGSIACLLKSFLATVRRTRYQGAATIAVELVLCCLRDLGILLLFTSALGTLSSLASTPAAITRATDRPVGQLDVSSLLAQALSRATLSSARFIASIIIVGLFAVLLVSLAFPRTAGGAKTSRKQALADVFTMLGRECRTIIRFAVAAYFVAAALLLVATIFDSTFDAAAIIQVSQGWHRYFLAIVLVYLFMAIILVAIFNLPPSSSPEHSQLRTSATGGWIYVASILAMMVVPAYALNVYPSLPQQLGGGSLLPVRVLVSDNDLKSLFNQPETQAFLIDRTANGVLFLLYSPTTQESIHVEVAANLVHSIIYNVPTPPPSPTPSPTPIPSPTGPPPTS